MSREEDELKILREENKQLKLGIAQAQMQIQQKEMQMGTRDVMMAKMAMDGLFHIFRIANGATSDGVPAQQTQQVKADIEKVVGEVMKYLKTRNLVQLPGSERIN